MDDSVVHIFWDHSNLFARAKDTCDPGGNPDLAPGKEPGMRLALRLDFARSL